MNRSGLFSISLFGLLVSVTGADAADGQTEITDTFCTKVQTTIMSNTIPAQTMVHPDFDAFVLSKASVDPLRNEQFTTTGPDGAPRIVSCKMKTPDHIAEVYGEDKVNPEALSCEAINRANVSAVIAALTPEEAANRVLSDAQIIFDEDISVMMGTSWTKPFDFAYRGKSGALHIQSKRMQIDWTSLLFKMAHDRFKGALYCHLIAPEYAKALILGTEQIPAPTDG